MEMTGVEMIPWGVDIRMVDLQMCFNVFYRNPKNIQECPVWEMDMGSFMGSGAWNGNVMRYVEMTGVWK